jgi:hypothetical protein
MIVISYLYNELKMNEECCICYEEMVSENSKLLRCNHLYHNDCIYKWSIKQNSCPKCRYFFRFETNNKEDFLEWINSKMHNLYNKLDKEGLLMLIEITDTLIIHVDKGIKCPSKIYQILLKKIQQNEHELRFTYFRWFCNCVLKNDNSVSKNGWYERTLKKLVVLLKESDLGSKPIISSIII